MTFDLVPFLAAIALLWVPVPVHPEQIPEGVPSAADATMGGLFRAWQNWIDLIRSSAATYALVHLAIKPDPTDPMSASSIPYLQAGVLGLGLLFQMARFNPELAFYSPIFYLTGLAVQLPGYVPGGFALAFGWALAIGTRQPRFLLPASATMLMLAGYFVDHLTFWLAVTTALLLAPVALAVLFRRRAFFASRETPSPKRRPARPSPESARKGGSLTLKSGPSTAK
jgi:hypothetical protein